MQIPFIAPEYGLAKFNCPHCGAVSGMEWAYRDRNLNAVGPRSIHGEVTSFPHIRVASALCACCNKHSYWIHGDLAYPRIGLAPAPHPDMPEAVSILYREASEVSSISPRAAAALLRLAVEHLVTHLLPGSGSINNKIGELVKQGLNRKIQQAMDYVRVVGNNAVHPGQIAFDDAEIASTLFRLLNIIVQEMISNPKEVDDLYNSLPTSSIEAVEKRDRPAPPASKGP